MTRFSRPGAVDSEESRGAVTASSRSIGSPQPGSEPPQGSGLPWTQGMTWTGCG